MLILDRIEPRSPSHVQVKIDEYIPLSVSLYPDDSTHKVYWRARPSPYTLLEIGLSSRTGALSDVTLTAIEPSAVEVVETHMTTQTGQAIPGHPLMDLSAWRTSDVYADRFYDVSPAVGLLVAQTVCTVYIGTACPPEHVVLCGCVRIGFGKHNRLCSIDIPLNEPVHRQTLLRFGQTS